MRRISDPAFWYWTATAIFLGTGLAGKPFGFLAATGLTAIHLVHYLVWKRSLSALSVQVRIFYLAYLACGQLPGAAWIYWLPFVGTTMLILFDYCLAARFLSLMPWNRRMPMSGKLVARTFLSRPVPGSFLDHIDSIMRAG